MSKTYNQLTSKLEKKDVNGHTVTMKGSGCGVCSLASIAYNIKTSYTLEKVWEYMVKKGYTIREGTTRTGMTECIKYYGMKSTYYTSTLSGGANHTKLMTAMKALSGSSTWAILLMYGKSKGGKSNYWTSGGHFIAATDYDKTNGFYVRDSANGRTGWHPEADFKGCIVAGWVITPASTTSKVTTAVKKVTSSTSKVYNAKCAAKAGVNIRTSGGTDTGKNVPYGKTVLVKKKSACTMTIKGTKYTMMKVTYGTTTGYVAQKYFSF